MTADAGIRYVRLEGEPLGRGQAQGEALRPVIALGMERWKETIQRSTDLHPDEYLDRFLEATDFRPAIERWVPHLLDEVWGIADGAGLPYRDVYAYQLMDEEWLYRTDYLRERRRESQEHCSVVGVWGEGGPAILAQNMDLPKHYDGTQTLLHVVPSDGGPEALIFTAAGLIGTCGLNSAGLGLCVNTLAQLAQSRAGLPVAFITRRLLELPQQEEAVAFVRAVEHASGQNYAIGGPGAIVDFECSAHGVVPFPLHPTRLYHTNHPLVNDDLAAQPQAVGASGAGKGGAEGQCGQPVLSNSERRFAFLQRALSSRTVPFGVENAKAILSSCEVPICVSRSGSGDGMTLGSLVMELSVPPVLNIAPGPPAETAYTRWTF
jgi:hypothetical protein